MPEFLLISTTTPTAEAAEQIAVALVDQRLAACVQTVAQVKSIYRWQGKVEQAEEWLCVIKTRRDLFPKVAAEIERLHSYDCPEIVATELVAASATYSNWLNQQLQEE